MTNITKLIKYLPTILAALDIIGKLANAFKKKYGKPVDEPTPAEDIEIQKQSNKLIDLGYNFVPEKVQVVAKKDELVYFKNEFIKLVDQVKRTIQAFIPLTK